MEQVVYLNKKKIKGFTIVELLVAMVIFSLILIFMLQSFLLAYKINFSNEVKSSAVQIAQEELENLRNKPINEIYDGSNVIYCPSPCNPDTTDDNCKITMTIKGAKVVFGKAIEVNNSSDTFLDINLIICSKVKDWRTGDNISYKVRTILANIGD